MQSPSIPASRSPDVDAAMAYYFDNVEEIQDGFRKDEEWARWAEENLLSWIPSEMKEKLGGESRSDSISTSTYGQNGATFQLAKCRRDACTTTGPNDENNAKWDFSPFLSPDSTRRPQSSRSPSLLLADVRVLFVNHGRIGTACSKLIL